MMKITVFLLVFLSSGYFYAAIAFHVINEARAVIGGGTLRGMLCDAEKRRDAARTSGRLIRLYVPMFLSMTVDRMITAGGIPLYAGTALEFFLLVAALRHAREVPGLNCYLIGGCLNMIACLMNEGFMPTFHNPWPMHTHVLMTAATRCAILSDWILVENMQFSIGDILIAEGVLLFLAYQMFIFVKYLLGEPRTAAVG